MKVEPYSSRVVPLAEMVRLPCSANVPSYTTNSGPPLLGFTMTLARMQNGFVKKLLASKSRGASVVWKLAVDSGPIESAVGPPAGLVGLVHPGFGVTNEPAATQFWRISLQNSKT